MLGCRCRRHQPRCQCPAMLVSWVISEVSSSDSLVFIIWRPYSTYSILVQGPVDTSHLNIETLDCSLEVLPLMYSSKVSTIINPLVSTVEIKTNCDSVVRCGGDRRRSKIGLNEWRSEGMKEWRSEGMKEWRNEGMKEWRNEGMKEWRSEETKGTSSEGAKEKRKKGAKERRCEGVTEWRSEGVKEWRSEGVKEWRNEGIKEWKNEGGRRSA